MATSSTSTTSSLFNSNYFTVDSNGKLQVGGIASGLDTTSIINAIMTAKRAPAVQLESKITANTSKISAYTEFQTKTAAVTTALDALRGNPGSTTNVFNTKSVSGSTTSTSGTASSIDSLMVVTVDSTAQNMTHTIKINSLAAAQQVRSDAFTSTSTALADMGFSTGTMTIGGKDITISSTTTLLDLKSQINNAGAGVTASIVSADGSTNYLVLTASDTGTANAISFSGDATVTNSLGLTYTDTNNSNATTVKNELVPAADANIDVDGITGITRSSNSISDVINGVTLSLLKSEPDTTVTLKVETDLSGIKTALNSFVTAYNDMRTWLTDQRTASDRNNDGTVADNEYGPLAYDSTVRTIMSKLSDMVSGVVGSAADGYQSLGQVGIVMNSDYSLEIDDTILDAKLLNNVSGVQDLFSQQTSVSDSRVTVLSVGTDALSASNALEITGTDSSGNVTGATWNGVAMTVNGKTLTAADGTTLYFGGDANLGTISGITVDINRGLADQYYDYFNNTSKASTGTLATQITDLQTQNTDYQDRVTTIDDRLTTVRTALEAKYTAMETAMAKLETLQNTIKSYSTAASSSGG